MSKKLMWSVLALLVFGCMAWGAEKSFRGVISDSHCNEKHATAGDEAAKCVAQCISNGSKYVLVSHGKVYQLDPQDKISSDLAGRNARIKGALSGDTITVSSAEAAPAGKKAETKPGQ